MDAEPGGLRDDIAAISEMISGSYPDEIRADAEVHGWRRIAKVQEEAGEVMEAWLGYLGENPRKGRTHSLEDVIAELLDVAGAALGAVEHLTGDQAASVRLLAERICFVRGRLAEAVAAHA
jgi:NTP pyrophosphatase (non-canonical NTP hydrolase)